MDAEAIVHQARVLGIALSVAGDNIRYAPKSATPLDLVEMLRKHKAELLAYLRRQPQGLQGKYRLVYPGQGAPDDPELAEIVQRVNEEGYVLLWSTVLEDSVAFYKTEADRKNIPPGFVPYNEQELQELFGEGKDVPSANHLRLIHEAKKHGGRIIGSEPDCGKERP